MPTIKIHNVITGEIIEREMNVDELADYQAKLAAIAKEDSEIIEAESKRRQILDRLGLTAEEAKLLLG